MSTWYTADEAGLDRLVGAWADAPVSDEETLSMLLEVAAGQVWAFSPEATPTDDYTGPLDGEGYIPTPDMSDDTVPPRLVYAQLRQATNLWDAGRVNSNGDAGIDGFVYTPRPLDKTIRGIIRPQRGTFDV